MKKFKIGVLALIACLFLTGCGCSNKKVVEFTVSFDSNGGTAVAEQVITKGEKVSEPSNPTRSGYTFDGWYLDDAKYDFSTPVTKDITLTAKWVTSAGGEVKPTCKLTCEEGYELINGDSENCECKKKIISVSSISLSKTNVTLLVGESATIKATVNPSNANDKAVTWKSSDTKVVTVKDGKLTAVAEGTAKVTVTAGGKSNTINVTVTTKDKQALNNAMNAISAKNITEGGASLNYTYSGCTITNTANVVSNGNKDKTVIDLDNNVKTLYRTRSKGSISSTYNVVCGSESSSKTVTHTIPASTYNYDRVASVNPNSLHYVLRVAGLKGYRIYVGKMPLDYVAEEDGVRITPQDHVKGSTYEMKLGNTIYVIESNEK